MPNKRLTLTLTLCKGNLSQKSYLRNIYSESHLIMYIRLRLLMNTLQVLFSSQYEPNSVVFPGKTLL